MLLVPIEISDDWLSYAIAAVRVARMHVRSAGVADLLVHHARRVTDCRKSGESAPLSSSNTTAGSSGAGPPWMNSY